MSAEQMPVSGAPTPDEVRTAVTHIVVSDTFKRSPQLSAFLRYVVDALLNGHCGRIKGYTIGVEVLRRDINFDPQLDPIVRVEATRLRRTLERYYQGPGAADRVMIEIPLGTYVPTFRYRPGEDVVRQRGPGFSRWPDLAAYFNRRGPAGALALATMSIGVMGAFALIFVPPLIAFGWAKAWRRALLLTVICGLLAYSAAFALALVLDQPFGPLLGLLLVTAGVCSALLRRLSGRE